MDTVEDHSSKALDAFEKLKQNSFVLKYSDGTNYIKLPNGVIKRISKRAYELRKNPDLVKD
jgi:hypothetical protein